ncbi:unnamed protein product, partial [Ilex paraguariensis]
KSSNTVGVNSGSENNLVASVMNSSYEENVVMPPVPLFVRNPSIVEIPAITQFPSITQFSSFVRLPSTGLAHLTNQNRTIDQIPLKDNSSDVSKVPMSNSGSTRVLLDPAKIAKDAKRVVYNNGEPRMYWSLEET